MTASDRMWAKCKEECRIEICCMCCARAFLLDNASFHIVKLVVFHILFYSYFGVFSLVCFI